MVELRNIRKRRPRKGISLTPSKTEPYWACPEETCEAIFDPPAARVRGHWVLPSGVQLDGYGVNSGFGPKELESAYDIPPLSGSSETVALVDPYGYLRAEEDLAIYRNQYHLPPCTKGNGCFSQLDQAGDEVIDPTEGWQGEQALDLDMASAACPECKIMLVEAESDLDQSLAEADETAAEHGATVISNSCG